MTKISPAVVMLSILISPIAASAEEVSQPPAEDRGGRLGQVSAGLNQATGGDKGGPTVTTREPPYSAGYNDRYHYPYGYSYERRDPVISLGSSASAEAPTSNKRSAKVDFYAGAQKVYESDGAVSLELACNDGRLRIGVAMTRYYERQAGSKALTFTLPALYLGWRIDDGGPTRAYVEAGGIGAETSHDPMMDSSIVGVLGGVRVEHQISRQTAAVADAQAMVFEEDVRGGAVRAGVRYGHLQAAVRYLDLSVGPALFGPEIGLRF